MAFKICKIFQTIKDKGHPESVLDEGGIKCFSQNAWLTPGYYFWENEIELAHYWGETHVKGDYIICESEYELHDLVWDLDNHYPHKVEYRDAKTELSNNNASKGRPIYVRQVIEFLKKTNKLKYEAIRAEGVFSFGKGFDEAYENITYFEQGKPSFYNCIRAVQICFFEPTLHKIPLTVAFPDFYMDDFYV
jgi:hypothetical protein